MKRNHAAFFLSYILEAVCTLAGVFLIALVGWIQHASFQNGTEGCFVLVCFFSLTPLL